jgi:hypothetical protein
MSCHFPYRDGSPAPILEPAQSTSPLVRPAVRGHDGGDDARHAGPTWSLTWEYP